MAALQTFGVVVATILMASVVVLTTCGHILALVRRQKRRAIKNLLIAYIVLGTMLARPPVNQFVSVPLGLAMLVLSTLYMGVRVIQFGVWARGAQRDGVTDPPGEGAGDAERLLRFLRRSIAGRER